MNIKKILLSLLLIPSSLFAQELDNLKQKAQRENTAKVWNELAEFLYHKRENPQLLKEAANNALSIAQIQNDTIELGRSFIYLSDLHYQDGDIDNYLLSNRKALQLLLNTEEYGLQEEALNNMATAHGEKDHIDSLVFFVQEAIRINRLHNGNLRQLGNEYQNMAYAYSIKGLADSSLYYTQKTIDVLRLAEDTLRMLDAYNQMGVIYVKNKNYPLALNYFNEALSIYEQIENKHNRVYLYTNLSALYLKWGDVDKAVDFGRKAVHDGKKSSEKITYGKLLCNLGNHLYKAKAYESSIDTIMEALPLIKNSHYYIGACYQLLAGNYSALQKTDSAQLYLSKVDSLATLNQFVRSELFYLSKINILVQGKEYQKAVPYAHKIIEIDAAKELDESNGDKYNLLSIVLEKGAGDYKKALEYKKLAFNTQDSLYQKKVTKELNEFYTQYQTKEKDLEISQLNAERQRILYNRALAVGGLIILSALLIVILLYYRIKRYKSQQKALELSKKLERKELEFNSLHSEREKHLMQRYFEGREEERRSLAKELHDSIANDIVSVIMLHESGTGDLKLKLRDIHNHVRQISHKLMPPEFKFISIVDMIEDHVEILNTAKTTLFLFNAPNQDTIDTIENLPDNQKKNIYYIIQEALENIRKHAQAKTGEVMLLLDKNKQLLILIKDDGIGFSQKGLSRNGIGLQTIESRCSELKAKLDITSAPNMGTEIKVSLCDPIGPKPTHQS